MTRLVHARWNIAHLGVPALAVRQVDVDDPHIKRLARGEVITLLERAPRREAEQEEEAPGEARRRKK